MAKTAEQKIEAAIFNERISLSLMGVIRDSMGIDDLRQLQEAAGALADELEAAETAIDEWHEEDDREARADAKDGALEALGEVIEKLADLRMLVPWPPDPDRPLPEVEPEPPVVSAADQHAKNLAFLDGRPPEKLVEYLADLPADFQEAEDERQQKLVQA